MNAAELIAKVLAKRQAWVELKDGRSVLVQRPGEVQMAELRGGLTVARLASYVVGWRGFTERHILGESQHPDTAVEFDRDLWVAISEDDADAASEVATKLMEMVNEHINAREANRGN